MSFHHDPWFSNLLNSDMAVASISENGCIDFCSMALVKLLGCDKTGIVGRSFSELSGLQSGSWKSAKEALAFTYSNPEGRRLILSVRILEVQSGRYVVFFDDRSESETSKRMTTLLARITEDLGVSLELQTTVLRAAQIPLGLLCDWSAIFLIDDGRKRVGASEHLNSAKSSWLEKFMERDIEELSLDFGLCRVVQSGEPSILKYDFESTQGCVLSLPLIRRHEVIGVICLGRDGDQLISTDDVFLAQELANRTAIALENAKLYEMTDCVKRELLHAKRVAEEASQAKTNFLANMSHEIRTPLGGVLGFAELLVMDAEQAGIHEEWIARIRHNGNHLLRLIDDILDLSKVEAGKLDLHLEDVSFQVLLQDLYALLENRASEKNLKLGFYFMTSIPTVFVSDSTRLHQILANLIGNALKFTDAGEVTVLFEYDEKSSNLSVDVTDSGPGLTEEQTSRLFVPFSQGDSSHARKYGGTGLGLALSRHLAKLLGGSLDLVTSKPGEGTCFRLQIPIRVADGATAFSRVSGPIHHLTGRDTRDDRHCLDGIKVLLVDDSNDNQMLISHFVKVAGASVEVASDGQTAINMAMNSDFDIVLMDIQMPGMDGIEATLQLRQLGFQRPIVALTAHAMLIEKERCLAAGCDRHITKPINRDHLISSIFELTHTLRPWSARSLEARV